MPTKRFGHSVSSFATTHPIPLIRKLLRLISRGINTVSTTLNVRDLQKTEDRYALFIFVNLVYICSRRKNTSKKRMSQEIGYDVTTIIKVIDKIEATYYPEGTLDKKKLYFEDFDTALSNLIPSDDTLKRNFPNEDRQD